MSEKWIFDDVGAEHNDIVGKKCANLGEMRRAGIPVPPGFAISLRAYEKFMTETGATDEIREYLETFSADPDNPANIPEYDDAAKVIRGIVESKKMPDDMAGSPRSANFLFKAANRRMVGAALGSIIAIIMTHHINSISAK